MEVEPKTHQSELAYAGLYHMRGGPKSEVLGLFSLSLNPFLILFVLLPPAAAPHLLFPSSFSLFLPPALLLPPLPLQHPVHGAMAVFPPLGNSLKVPCYGLSVF